MEHKTRDNFKQLRMKIGISQEQMANYLELDQTMIAKFESGERNLKASDVERACLLFGCDIRELYKDNPQNKIGLAFRKGKHAKNVLNDTAVINKIALNIIRMDQLLEKFNED